MAGWFCSLCKAVSPSDSKMSGAELCLVLRWNNGLGRVADDELLLRAWTSWLFFGCSLNPTAVAAFGVSSLCPQFTDDEVSGLERLGSSSVVETADWFGELGHWFGFSLPLGSNTDNPLWRVPIPRERLEAAFRYCAAFDNWSLSERRDRDAGFRSSSKRTPGSFGEISTMFEMRKWVKVFCIQIKYKCSEKKSTEVWSCELKMYKSQGLMIGWQWSKKTEMVSAMKKLAYPCVNGIFIGLQLANRDAHLCSQ